MAERGVWNRLVRGVRNWLGNGCSGSIRGGKGSWVFVDWTDVFLRCPWIKRS